MILVPYFFGGTVTRRMCDIQKCGIFMIYKHKCRLYLRCYNNVYLYKFLDYKDLKQF